MKRTTWPAIAIALIAVPCAAESIHIDAAPEHVTNTMRPDGQWALLIVNKDQDNEHSVTVRFDDPIRGRSGGFSGPVESIVFGKAEYRWHPAEGGGHADPDGPPQQTTLQAQPGTIYHLPKASITVLRGRSSMTGSGD